MHPDPGAVRGTKGPSIGGPFVLPGSHLNPWARRCATVDRRSVVFTPADPEFDAALVTVETGQSRMVPNWYAGN